MRPLSSIAVAIAVATLGCSAVELSVGQFESASSGISTASGTETGSESSDDGWADTLDVSSGADLPDTCAGDECNGCSFVDLLFIIDNSSSTDDYQDALSQAFPSFANAIFELLPPGTNVHIGVTSTTMGVSSSGATTNCTATGDDMQPVEAFYETPDEINNGIEGAQGRLFPAGGEFYFELNTNEGPDTVVALTNWFSEAVHIGEGGSQIEMAAAPAAWALDPANDATNAGFLRDEGSVLVLFFIQDEPDQTPQGEAQALVQKIGAAKAGCGGMDCVVGGGFVDEFCLGEVPLGVMLDAIGDPVVDALPFFDENATPELFESVLRDTLAQVIVDTCETIPPVP